MKLHSFGLGSFVLDEIPGEKGIFPSFAYTGIASVFYLSMRLVIGAFFIRALIWLVKEETNRMSRIRMRTRYTYENT